MTKSISVVIPVYNGEKYIREAVLSIVKQTYPVKEILIVNDGSTDGTLNELEELRISYDNIRVFSTKNKGVSAARNLGISKASADLVAFLDADDYWEQSKLAEQVSFMKKENCQVVISSLNLVNEDGLCIGFNDNSGDKIISDILLKKLSMMTPTLIFERELICEGSAIKFDERLKHFEDHLFIIQLLIKGKGRVLNKRLVNRRVHSESSSTVFNIESARLSIEVFHSEISKLLMVYNLNITKELTTFYSSAVFSLAHMSYRNKERLTSIRFAAKSYLIEPNFKALVLLLLASLPWSKHLFNRLSKQSVLE